MWIDVLDFAAATDVSSRAQNVEPKRDGAWEVAVVWVQL
jgi:hypothetical protein